jgi:MFS family permease
MKFKDLIMKISTEFLVQFISSLSMLSMFTYVPFWANKLGLTNLEITLLAISYGFTIFGTNLIVGRMSDRIGLRKPFIITGLIVTSISIISLTLPTNFLEFLFTRSLTGIGYGMYIPTLTALVTDKNLKLGKFSSAGTAAWAVGVLISGVIGIFWVPGIFIFSGLVLFGASIIALSLKEEKSTIVKYKFSTLMVFWQRKRVFSGFIVRHSLASAVWVLWPLYLASIGADELALALVQLLNPVTSSIIMNRFTDRVDSKIMVNLGLILTGFTFLTYLLATSWIFILPAQIILGFSWAFIYVGVLRYGIESSDFDKSTVAGWINSIQSISVIVGSAISFLVVYAHGTVVDLIVLAAIGSFSMFIINYLFDFKANSIEISTTKAV